MTPELNIPEKEEVLSRLEMKEAPEQVTDLAVFGMNWLTLKEAAEIAKKSDRWVRNLCAEEKIESKTFVGGKFGMRPVRCVNKMQFQEWYQATMNKTPEQVVVQGKQPEFTQNQALTQMMNFRDTVQGISKEITDLNHNIVDTRTQMMNIFKELMVQGKDISEKWYQTQEKRAEAEQKRSEIEHKRIEMEEKRIVTEEKRAEAEQKRAETEQKRMETEYKKVDLHQQTLSLQEKQLSAQQELINKISQKPKTSPWVWLLPIILVTFFSGIVVLGIYAFRGYQQKMDTVRSGIRSMSESHVVTINAQKNNLMAAEQEIIILKDLITQQQEETQKVEKGRRPRRGR